VPEGDRLADERAELELVLDELRREGGAVGQLADVLGAIDDDELALLVEEAGVAGAAATPSTRVSRVTSSCLK
jgi:hypothetical protein